MTKKISVFLPEELHAWAVLQVQEGRAGSVSALIAEGLELMRSRQQLAELVADLRAEVGEIDEETQARVDAAMQAMEEAQRRHLLRA